MISLQDVPGETRIQGIGILKVRGLEDKTKGPKISRTGRLEDQRTCEIEAIRPEGKNWRPRRPQDQNVFNLDIQMTIGLKDTREDCEFGGNENRRTKGLKDERTRGQ